MSYGCRFRHLFGTLPVSPTRSGLTTGRAIASAFSTLTWPRNPPHTGRVLTLFADESEQGKFLGVGGFYLPLARLLDLERLWRQLKVGFGLDAQDEIKWTLPAGHPTRENLAANQHTTRQLQEAAINLIAQTELIVVVAVMVEIRKLSWRDRLRRKRLSPRDFYCEGLRYVLQRFNEQAFLQRQAHQPRLPLLCVVDRPGTAKSPSRSVQARIAGTTIRLGEGAALDQYKDGFALGPGEGPAHLGNQPMRNLDFHSALLVSAAAYSDALQVADVMVGCVTSWVADIHASAANPWLCARVRLLKPRFRGGLAGMFGDGFVLWPWQNTLWVALQNSII